MADVIQFHCPACGTALRLPRQMAALRGPCPCCHKEIVAPDPDHGIGAHEPVPPPPSENVPTIPTGDSLPPLDETQAQDSPVEPFDQRPSAEAPLETARTTAIDPKPGMPCQAPQRAVLVAFIFVAAAAALVAGYFLGVRSTHQSANDAVPTAPNTSPVTPEIPLAAAAPAPEPAPPAEPEKMLEPVPSSTPEPEPATPPAAAPKTSEVAESALKAFLDAPDWKTRSAHVLDEETVRQAMEDYSHKASDGPTAYQSISIENSYTDKQTGYTLFIFQVVTPQHTPGIPVAVVETAAGWRIDWKTFIEFRDDLFKSFADGPVGQTGRFHLIVSTPPPPRAAKTENEHFTPFQLDPPLPGRQRLAYVRKTSEIHPMLTAATTNGIAFTPVLELVKRETPDGKSYLEIIEILATDWLPKNH